MIDYGLSRRYRDLNTHEHIPPVEGRSLTGTARYASLAASQGLEPSRRDDLESLGFVLIYLLRGSLPWMGLQCADPPAQFALVREMKAQLTIEQLCAELPDAFVRYFAIVRALEFTEAPRYAELRLIFRNLFNQMGFIYDRVYDWDLPTLQVPRPEAPRSKSCRVSTSSPARQNRVRKRLTAEEYPDTKAKKAKAVDDRKVRIRGISDHGSALARRSFSRLHCGSKC
jgi:casein kinase 1